MARPVPFQSRFRRRTDRCGRRPSVNPGAIMWNPLDEVVRRQKAGEPHGITSVCSAHPLVIEAAVRQALASGGTVLAEATSNQVDQYGGYTGMRPEDFRELV